MNRSIMGILAACLLLASPASATIMHLVDDFEAEALANNFNAFDNWNVSVGTVDTVGPSVSAIDCQGSSVCVDLDGSTGDAGAMTTKEDFAAGTYELSFDLSGNQRGGATDTVLLIFGPLVELIFLSATDPWTTFERTVTLTTADFLTIAGTGGDNVGPLLDNVSVRPLAFDIPEPSTNAIFLMAVVGLGLAAWRRHAPS